MDRFKIPSEGAMVSNDGDALGKLALALDLALAMKARVELPKKTSRTAIVAQLRLPVGEGKERNIDVLHQLYTISGLKKSGEFTANVIKDSVQVEWRQDKFIRVMEPFDVLESRVQNAVGLFDEKGPHVLTQATWAIQVAKAALMKLARDPASEDRLGRKLQRIYKLAHSQVGKRLLAEHQIEILDAVDVASLRSAAPAQGPQLDAVARAKAKRASPLAA